MSCPNDKENLSLADLLASAIAAYANRSLSAALSQLYCLQTAMSGLSLFSSNEASEDLATDSMPFLSVSFYIATILLESPLAVASTSVADVHREQRVDDARTGREERDRKRLEILAEAKREAGIFLALLCQYSIIDGADGTAHLDGMQEGSVAEMAQKRRLKIDRIRQIGELAASHDDGHLLKMELLHKRQQHTDEERRRSWWMGWLKLKGLRALDLLASIGSEVGVLSAHRLSGAPVTTPTSSEAGAKVMQPFVLTSRTTDDRRALASQVFRPGHRLPTMSIDEYLALEMRRGNIKSQAIPSTASTEGINESDETEDEKRLLQLRRQDEFRDEHRRGSGNTFNRG